MVGCTAGDGEPVSAVPTPSPTTPTSAKQPTLTPVRGRGALAYGVDGDIYVADADGSNAVRIVDGRPPHECGGGEYWAEGPIWSPDGRYLAFRRTDCQTPREKWWDLVISDRKGNVVASIPGQGWRIAWSPDSTRVAVWIRWGETIGIYGLDGVRQTVLTVPDGWMALGDLDPVWSRDGEALVVPNGVVIPVDGSEPRRLPRAVGWATYSPDGSHLASDPNGSLVVAQADGSLPEEPSSPWFGAPVWSPSGDRIAFASRGWHELRVFDMVTGTTRALARNDSRYGLWPIEFSSDGNQILYAKSERRGVGVVSLWTVEANGSHPHRLVAGTGWGDWRTPSPTG